MKNIQPYSWWLLPCLLTPFQQNKFMLLLRQRFDIDLLLDSAAAVRQAADALAAHGYAPAFEPGDTHFELTLRRSIDGRLRSELDLHSRLLNAAVYADVFSFAALWESGQALPGYGASLRALSPRHALAHACLNRALDLQNGIPDRLKLLYDLRLLA
ncbi:MAG: hypothetical protein DWB48_05405, partial [Nitrosomonas sp.]|nr:hypothetical protein [Nitrosomonas sp.]